MNARAPLTSLTRSHAQRGWGGFDRCMTYAMQGLAVCLPSKAAEGRTTAYQVAIASHVTDRWAREGLKRLEKAGLISWERGGIGPDGCPRPSWIRVDKRAYLAWINLREWVKRKKDNAVARYRAYRERVSKIEHAPQPPEQPVAPAAASPASPASPAASAERHPCDMVYTPEQVSELKDRLLSRGYIPDRVSWMLRRPVPGWDGWQLAREFEAEHGDPGYGVQEARDPEGRLLKRFSR
nr:MAG TPA: winged helix-turn-helix DNA-binding protein [Caudoviricetes sp.]